MDGTNKRAVMAGSSTNWALWAGVVLALILAIVALALAAKDNDSSEGSKPRYITLTNTTAEALETGGAPTIMKFDTIVAQSASTDFSVSDAGVVTVKNAGIYQVSYNVAMDATVDPVNPVAFWIQRSGATGQYGLDLAFPLSNTASSTNNQFLETSTTIKLAADETLTVRLQAPAVQSTLPNSSYLAISRISAL
jgi:hypothetical protein